MKDERHVCAKCQRAFPSGEAHARHVKKVHGGKAPWGRGKIVASVIVLLLVSGGVAALAWRASQPQGPVDVEAQFSLSGSPRQGSDDAPVKLFAFESPACSSCRFFHLGDGRGPSVYERIIANHVEKGDVQYVEKTFYVGYPWERAGAAAQKCVWHSDPEKFHLLTTAFYSSQPSLGEDTLHGFLREWAQRNGVDADALEQCVREDRYIDEADADFREGRRAGARGTPTFIIVGPAGQAKIIAGPQSYHTFQAAIEDALVQ